MISKVTLSLVFVFGGVIFYFSPLIDQAISLLPYSFSSHTFYGETSYICQLIYFLVPCLTFIFIAFPLVIIVFKQRFNNVDRKTAIIILVALSIGPGFIVNTLCKNHWGRPRPYQVIRDHATFSPVWVPHFNRPLDNSFCSGHAAIGFFCGVPLWGLRRRKLAIVMSLVGGGIIGIVRILQGGHYLSDVLFAGVFVWVGLILAQYIVDNLIYTSFIVKD